MERIAVSKKKGSKKKGTGKGKGKAGSSKKKATKVKASVDSAIDPSLVAATRPPEAAEDTVAATGVTAAVSALEPSALRKATKGMTEDEQLAVRQGHAAVVETELGARRQAVEEYRQLAEQLRAENTRLRNATQRKDTDYADIEVFLAHEVARKNKQLEEMMDAMDADALEAAKAKERTDRKWVARVDELRTASRAKAERIAAYRARQHEVDALKRRRQRMETEVERLTEQVDQSRLDFNQDIVGTDQAYYEQRQRLVREHETRMGELREKLSQQQQQQMDLASKDIFKANLDLAAELKAQLAQTAVAEKAYERAAAKRAAVAREMRMARERSEPLDEHDAKQRKTIERLRGKIKQIERQMNEAVRKFEMDRTRLLDEDDRVQGELDIEVDGLRELVRDRNADLRQAKRLARSVLDKHVLVERFLLHFIEIVRNARVDAMHAARKAERDEYNAQMRAASKGAHGYPSVKAAAVAQLNATDGLQRGPLGQLNSTAPGRSSSASVHSSTAMSPVANAQVVSDALYQRIDIRDLTLNDKERILRLLLARINPKRANAQPVHAVPPSSASRPGSRERLARMAGTPSGLPPSPGPVVPPFSVDVSMIGPASPT